MGKNITGEYKKVFENLEVLFIDEISFVPSYLLDGLSESLKKIRKNNAKFGGVTVVASGDLYQLPPILRNSEKKELKDLGYKSKYFFDSKVFTEITNDGELKFYHLPLFHFLILWRLRQGSKFLINII